jgi:hypothetical protein
MMRSYDKLLIPLLESGVKVMHATEEVGVREIVGIMKCKKQRNVGWID